MTYFPLHNARLLPADVNQILVLGGWLFGSAAKPDRDYRVSMPKDFDICVEPPEAPAVRMLLVPWTPVRHTKFGGTVYKSPYGDHMIDVWFSTLGETFRMLRPADGDSYAVNLSYNIGICFKLG
jgi:hypothetical protein